MTTKSRDRKRLSSFRLVEAATVELEGGNSRAAVRLLMSNDRPALVKLVQKQSSAPKMDSLLSKPSSDFLNQSTTTPFRESSIHPMLFLFVALTVFDITICWILLTFEKMRRNVINADGICCCRPKVFLFFMAAN
jgi:hypothetical protein